ncbi:MAG: imidazole glycerol phosphate synthase subunit HisH [Chitinophagaceae bacterium]
MKIAIVKYNAGNIQSVLYALERIGVEATVTDDHQALQSADKVIFPGVGEASTAMRYLKDRNLDGVIRELRQPVFGICLGMQLMCAHSEENDIECLGIFAEQVKKFTPPSNDNNETELATARFKVPQIGWNNIFHLKSALFTDVPENSFIYLVHSYYASLGDHTIAVADYITHYSAALHRDNFYGVQFHPEKSADVGELIINNFLRME